MKVTEPMTAEELRRWLSDTFGLNPWPKELEVHLITYANCVQSIIKHHLENPDMFVDWNTLKMTENTRWYGNFKSVIISVGPNKGIMFKNVELIVKDN